MILKQLQDHQCRGNETASLFFYLHKMEDGARKVVRVVATTDAEVQAVEDRDGFSAWLDDDGLNNLYAAMAHRQYAVGG